MYLGDDSSIPLINRGGGSYNTPETATPFKPGTMLQDFLTSLSPAAPKPLIVQGGGTYNYPEVYGASTASSYTPPARAKADLNKLLMVVAASTAIGFLIPTKGRRRSLW